LVILSDSWNINGKWISDRTRAEGDNRKDLGGYTWVNSKLQKNNIIDGLDGTIIINNTLMLMLESQVAALLLNITLSSAQLSLGVSCYLN
jgi:hypothetical protein